MSALEQNQVGLTSEAMAPPAGIAKFVQDLAKDVKQAQIEVQLDQAAMVQDKNDGVVTAQSRIGEDLSNLK